MEDNLANRSSSRLVAGGFEQLDRVPVGILEVDLAPSGPCFHVVAELKSRLLQRADEARKVPSGIGRDPEASGPLSRSCDSSSETLANAGRR